MKPVVPWAPELYVVDPAPIVATVERLGRKGGREVEARCPSRADADLACAWLVDRLSRFAPELAVTTQVESGGGQFLLVLRTAWLHREPARTCRDAVLRVGRGSGGLAHGRAEMRPLRTGPICTIDVMPAAPIVGHADTARREVRMQLALPTPVEQAWQALTDAEHTVSWLGRLDVGEMTDAGPFDLWHDDAVRSRHTVVQWHPRRLLTLTWDFPGERPSQVPFALAEPTTCTAMLTVHHQDLDDVVSYAAGWHRHLQYLEAHLRGRDLPIEDFWTDYHRFVELYETHQPL